MSKLIKQVINETTELNKKLLDKIHIYRLNYDLNIINNEILNNEKEEVNSKTNIFEKVASSVKNEIKETKLEKLNKQLKETNKRLEEVNNENITFDDLLKLVDKTFKKDSDDLSKYLFSISIIASNNEYFYADKSEGSVSILLWENASLLENIKKEFKSNFVKITSLGLSNNQKLVLAGTAGATLIASLLVAPSILSSVGKAAVGTLILPTGVTAITAACILGAGLSATTTYAGMKILNKEKFKEDLKKLSYEEISYILTVKALLLTHAKNVMSEDNFKEYLNDILLLTSDLKSDSLYYALVEKDDIERNEKLTEAFYRFDKILFKAYSV